MSNIYDEWNTIKKRIGESNHKPPFFKEGDIWWLSVGYNIGNEVYGKGVNFVRPVLVLRKFNRYLFLGVPLSSKLKVNPYYVEIRNGKKKVSALISQIRVFSFKRMSNKQGEVDEEDFQKIQKSVIGVLKLPPSTREGVVAKPIIK